MYKLLIILFSVLISSSMNAQKKIIDHTVYDMWERISNTQISENGNWVIYQQQPHKGNATIFLHQVERGNSVSIERGKKAQFLPEEKGIIALITPDYDTVRNWKLEKVKKENWTKDSLFVQLFKADTTFIIPDVLSYQISEQGAWFAYLKKHNYPEKTDGKERKCRLFSSKKEKDNTIESEGNLLVIQNVNTLEKIELDHVSKFNLQRQGEFLSYVTHEKTGDADSVYLHFIHLSNQSTKKTASFSEIGQLCFNKTGNHLAFFGTHDTLSKKEKRSFALYLWDFTQNQPHIIIDSSTVGIPEDFIPSNYSAPYFSTDDSKLFFGIQKKFTPEKKDTLLEDEKAVFDLWHYQDRRLQSQQLASLKRDKKKTYLSVYHLEGKIMKTLENDTLRITLPKNVKSQFALGISDYKYETTQHYNFPWVKDYYRINIESGEKKKIIDSIPYSYGLSPTGRYFVYFDSKTNHWKYKDFKRSAERCITCSMPDTTLQWTQDVNGMPHDPRPFGIEGYTKNDSSLLLYSKYDIWEIELNGNNANCITFQEGKNNNTVLRLKHFDKDSSYIDLERSIIHGVDQSTKNERFYRLSSYRLNKSLTLLTESAHKFVGLKKAQDTSLIIYQKMNVKDYPDVYFDNMFFNNSKKISNANPQQNEYRWPTVEKIEWKTPHGKELEGLVYLPEDLDTNKSYPMIVYFYELYANRKHQHYIPKPTASIIYPTEYVSAGYIVFIPDIRYDEGHPGQSAYECIMSGTDYVLNKYSFIDSNRMGLQGQSWGGYQTAQLITMTDRYKAAMAGAPVSNMFSAYGGIRWSSGLNRQFQYEHTQSRIGKTIWEAPELYYENSPIFGVPKISTPLLIMHNDNDGAVPWYQGIELFMGMKRLNKPVWLLNYNGDQHNLMKNANREDLSVRMRQFFDHFLLDKPAPMWIIEGIPAIEKGN